MSAYATPADVRRELTHEALLFPRDLDEADQDSWLETQLRVACADIFGYLQPAGYAELDPDTYEAAEVPEASAAWLRDVAVVFVAYRHGLGEEGNLDAVHTQYRRRLKEIRTGVATLPGLGPAKASGSAAAAGVVAVVPDRRSGKHGRLASLYRKRLYP